MKSVFLGLAVVAAMMFSGVTAQAGFINGGTSFRTTVGNSSSGTLTDTRAITNVKNNTGDGDFADGVGPADGTRWQNFTLTNPMTSPFTLDSTFGNFTGFRTSDILSANSRTITFAGSFLAGSAFTTAYDLTDANLTITLNQSTTGANTFFSSSVTLTTFGDAPAAVPEPTSIALFGLGALGLVVRRFRRK
ncbi:MAG: PEP-CTERM sorting domain-containing protein [Pirellula sp.]